MWPIEIISQIDMKYMSVINNLTFLPHRSDCHKLWLDSAFLVSGLPISKLLICTGLDWMPTQDQAGLNVKLVTSYTGAVNS